MDAFVITQLIILVVGCAVGLVCIIISSKKSDDAAYGYGAVGAIIIVLSLAAVGSSINNHFREKTETPQMKTQ